MFPTVNVFSSLCLYPTKTVCHIVSTIKLKFFSFPDLCDCFVRFALEKVTNVKLCAKNLYCMTSLLKIPLIDLMSSIVKVVCIVQMLIESGILAL